MKKTVVLVVVLLAATPLLLFSAAQKEAAAEDSMYGGTLTVFGASQEEDPSSPDIKDGFWPPRYLMPIEEFLLLGDFETYGPRGTGEFPFESIAYIPDKFLAGNLIESWEITPERTVWKVRQGIQWHDVPHVMGDRDLEMTADDLVADLIYFSESPAGSSSFKPMFNRIYAEDKYTVVIETPDFNVDLMYIVGYEDRATYTPPEVYEAPGGGAQWENRVGSGPWMFDEYVIGAYMKYKRNPNYWKTTTIDGQEYEYPFVDEMIKPIIPDISTRIANLRTGKIDWMWNVPPAHWSVLDDTEGLESKKFLGGFGVRWALNVQNPPLDNLEVRRALMKATDIDAFNKLVYAGVEADLPVHWYPMYPFDASVFTPMNQLPGDVRDLYDYDPEEAKQMLADAGYPNGFTLELNTKSLPKEQDNAALLKDQWAKIGVDLDILTFESAVQIRMGFEKDYKHVLHDDIETANPILTVRQGGETGHFLNVMPTEDSYVDEQTATLMAEVDPAKRAAMMKDLGVYLLGQVYAIPANVEMNANYWWPWLRNYYGEAQVGDHSAWEPVLATAWIDRNMKREMGY